MLVFRSLALGLLGACFLLLASRPHYEVRMERRVSRPTVVIGPPAATIVDVAAGVPAEQLAALVHLTPNERVIAVDDRPVAGNLDAGAVIAMRDATSRSYVDLTVATPAGSRRVLVLLH